MTKTIISDFPHIKANEHSIAVRKLVYGVGINDADYMVQPTINGKRLACPFYTRWKNVLQRCYSKKYHAKYPTYTGCTIAAEWFYFMSFRAWMVKQDWYGQHIDKDLLTHGNKIYSPDACLFVTGAINMLLTNHANDAGDYPQGVSQHAQSGKFSAHISIDGTQKYLGYFDTPEQAETVYKKAKRNNIIDIACDQKEPLRGGLLRHAALLA